MFRNDPLIDARAARSARMFQALFPLAFRLQYSSPAVRFAAKPIARPDRISIPTRHGDVAALVYRPTNADTERQLAAGTRPPVHLITHGGAFIVRVPQQEDNVARYLASEIGAFVVVPDYDTAPKVRFPVAEQQTYDVFRWIHENGDRMGWDSERVSVGGPSAGGKFALNVALQAIDEGGYRPVAVTSEYGVCPTSRCPTPSAPRRRTARWSAPASWTSSAGLTSPGGPDRPARLPRAAPAARRAAADTDPHRRVRHAAARDERPGRHPPGGGGTGHAPRVRRG